MTAHHCAYCGAYVPLADLLMVTRCATQTRRYVCRPSVSPGCFGSVKSAALESIAAAPPNAAGSVSPAVTSAARSGAEQDFGARRAVYPSNLERNNQ